MLKKLIVMLCLLGFIIQPILCEVESSRYIRLHSTQSSKTKKRPRSVALPIEITIDEQYLNIVCENSMQDVCVYISNKSNGSIIYDEMVSFDRCKPPIKYPYKKESL